MSHELVLDREVRDWVLVPLTLCIMLMMLLRQYMTKVFFGDAPPKLQTTELKEKQALARSNLFRTNCGYLTEAGFRQRRSYFGHKETGVLVKSQAPSTQEQMMTNPDMMVDMMKKNVGSFVPQILMGTFVNYFFSGFILGKVPFPLSPSFRPMLQRGLDLPSLDVTYFTSLSYYILLLFGLRGVFILLFRDDTIDDTQMYRQQMAMGMGQAGPGMDTQKLFDAERSQLELTEHKWRLESAEEEAAKILRQQLHRSATSAGQAFES